MSKRNMFLEKRGAWSLLLKIANVVTRIGVDYVSGTLLSIVND